jgi:hypothetical protein
MVWVKRANCFALVGIEQPERFSLSEREAGEKVLSTREFENETCT